MMTDPLGDMLTRIRNGQRAKLAVITSPASRLRSNVLKVLTDEGYIRGYAQQTGATGHPEIRIELKYHEGEAVIRRIGRVSRPGRRVYSRLADLPRHFGGLGTVILSTPQGVLSDSAAKEARVGGEVLCTVF